MKNLKALRKTKKLTQAEVAEELGIETNTYSRYENGTRSPSIDVLNKLADYFDTTVDYIIGRTDISTVPEYTPSTYTYPETTEYAAHLDDPNKPVNEERVREIIQEAFDLYQKKMNK